MRVRVYIHGMVTKTISITEEAYEALLREKKGDESFAETILRLTKKSGKLTDCFGTWKMSDEEEKTTRSELSKGWHKSQKRLTSEAP